MRQEMEHVTKQQQEQTRNKEMEQEREQIEKDKLDKQQLTQKGNNTVDHYHNYVWSTMGYLRLCV